MRSVRRQIGNVYLEAKLNQFGFELYAGDWTTIRDACRTEMIDDLRTGQYSESHLQFPSEFGAGDLLFVQDALATLTGNPVVELDFERDEPAGCMFADRLIPDWVSSVASFSTADGTKLMQLWSERYYSYELREPDWQQHIAGRLGQDLINLCRLSQDRSLDVVMIWFL